MGAYETFEKSTSNGDFSFEAKHDGRFVYCFGNEHWGASSKEVSFNVHGIVYVSESDAPQDPLEGEVRRLSELLAQVKDEQSYIVMRERTHRNTAESTNGRVKYWNLFVIGVVIGESVFQVWWLRRFFEVSLWLVLFFVLARWGSVSFLQLIVSISDAMANQNFCRSSELFESEME
jgi:hypothetical protein